MSGAIGAALSGGGLANMILGLYPPLSVWYNRRSFSMTPTLIPGVGDLLSLRKRGILSPAQFSEWSRENGFPPEISEQLFQISLRLLDPQQYVTLWRRGEISEEAADEFLHKIGVEPTAVQLFKKVTEFFPLPQDLIRFALREVYSPEIRSQFGMDEDRPDKYLEEAFKAGIPDEQAKNYWAAHWLLPSINQGFEMLHRGFIDHDELAQLLKALDIMPGWREKLLNISYNPLTRVDVRRMYRVGTLDRDGVKRAYTDIGYNDDNAELMTDFTVKYETDELSGITRANVVDAYVNDLLTDEDFQELLEGLGMSERAVKFWQRVGLYRRIERRQEMLKKDLIEQYQKGALSTEKLKETLSQKDVPSSFVDGVMRDVTDSEGTHLKIPSKADLERWLEKGVIDETDFNDRMSLLGYRPEDIQLYLTEFEMVTTKEKRRYLSIAVYQRWLKKGIMSPDDFISLATKLEYSEDDIFTMISEVMEVEVGAEG